MKTAITISFLLILTLPLLAIPPYFHPPAFGKAMVFRVILSIMMFLFTWRLFKKDEELAKKLASLKNRKSKVFYPFWLLVALLVIYILSTLFSLDPIFSFFGNPYRGGGSLTYCCYIIFAILGLLNFNKKDWQKIWDFAIFIGVLVSVVAVFQQFSLFSRVLIPYSGRPPSTLGGPIFLALYILLLFFMTLCFGIKEKNLPKKMFYFLSNLLFLFVIVLTGSRAGYFGLFVGLFYMLFLYPKDLIREKNPG